MKVCHKQIFLAILPLILVWMMGCGNKDDAAWEVERYLHELTDRLRHPRSGSWEFGCTLANSIFKLPDSCQKSKYQAQFEEIMLSARFDAPDYSDRFRQIGVFCDLVRFGPYATACSERNWIARIRMIGKLNRELSQTENLYSTEMCQNRENPSLATYVVKLAGTVTNCTERFEKQFNAKNGEMTEDQRSAIRSEFAQIMGRPIRTDEEIKRDRERKNEEARRRQEERLGNDVRLDIDSL